MACVLSPDRPYPHGQLYQAYLDMLLYDEHSWAYGHTEGVPAARDSCWLWKRNSAISASVMAEKLLDEATADVACAIPTAGKRSVAVFNNATWDRTDVLEVSTVGWPNPFRLVDPVSGRPVPCQANADRKTASFIAEDVPALRYRCYQVEAGEPAPAPDPGLCCSDDSIESPFFKVTFDLRTGSISTPPTKARTGRGFTAT